MKGVPGSLLGHRETAICRATVDAAIWIGHVKRTAGIKLPSMHAFAEAAALPELPLAGLWKSPTPTWQDIAYEEAGGVGFLSFEFYNGAMSTAQCRRLTAAFRWAIARPNNVIVLRGGSDFWSNGIHLNLIEAAESPADASWDNINAMDDLARLDGRPSPDQLVAMGGVVTNITAVRHRLATYDPTVVQGTVLDRTEIDRQIELYRTQDAASRRSIVGLQAKREEVILAGACIVRTIMEKLGKQTLTVSDRGLRHGVLAERFGT